MEIAGGDEAVDVGAKDVRRRAEEAAARAEGSERFRMRLLLEWSRISRRFIKDKHLLRMMGIHEAPRDGTAPAAPDAAPDAHGSAPRTAGADSSTQERT